MQHYCLYTRVVFKPAVPPFAEHLGGQRNWCKRELGEDVPVITCMSRDKHTYCRPGNVLIDDRYVFYLFLFLGKIKKSNTEPPHIRDGIPFFLCPTEPRENRFLRSQGGRRGVASCVPVRQVFGTPHARLRHRGDVRAGPTPERATFSRGSCGSSRRYFRRQVVSGGCLGACGGRFHPPHEREFVVGEAKVAASSGPATRTYGARGGRGRREREAPEEGVASILRVP